MEKHSIAVIGQGFVGGSLTTVFSERGFDVFVYDKTGKIAPGGQTPSKVSGAYGMSLSSTIDLVEACELEQGFSSVYFVCLPTPMNEDGSCYTGIVESVLDELASVSGKRIAVVKSTIPPGTTEGWNRKYEGTGLRVVFNPEFLREASALDDMRNQDRIILGGPKSSVNRVRNIFRQAFPSVPVFKTSSSNAETVKYCINTFLACKVSFANELFQICEALSANGQDIDYDRVIELATLDSRLGKSHWQVPGPMPADDGTNHLRRGWAGSCFVKDLNAMMVVSNKLGVDPKVLKGCWEKNLEVRPERDWEKLVGRAVVKKE